MKAPSAGASRGKPLGPGGYSRSDSSTTAWRYGSLAVAIRSISSSLANEDRTSAASFWSFVGFAVSR
jgi:hypothetical protein